MEILSLNILLFVILSLLIGVATRYLFKNTKVPYTVALLIIGVILGFFSTVNNFDFYGSDNLSVIVNSVANIEPHLILYLFLPILIFESAYSLEVHLFKRILSQIVILAIPGLLICTFATAAFAKLFFPWEWSWAIALMFGALISATDPVAVVALLKEVSSRKRLEALIEGESLLNDGTAIVLFTIFYGLAVVNNGDFSLSTGILNFIWVVSLGVIVGSFVGMLTVYFLGKVFNDPMIEITLTIISAYLAFIIAEYCFHVSGVVSVVTLSLILASIGRTRISPEVSHFLHKFWEMMAFIANTIIFLIVGIIIATNVNLESAISWEILGLLYLGVMVIRASSVVILTPILKQTSISFNKEKAVVLIWGGLRGAVSLALALAVSQNTLIPKEISSQILFLCAGIVFLTILINGSTMLYVLKMVGLDKLPPAKEATVTKAKKQIYVKLIDVMDKLKKNKFLQSVNWEEAVSRAKLKKVVTNNIIEESSEKDLVIACKRKLLETERQHYWSLFDDGMLGKTATNKLEEAVEHALDGKPRIGPRDKLYKYWVAPKYLQWCSSFDVLQKIAMHFAIKKLTIGYDIARGFISAMDEMLNFLPSLAPSEHVLENIKNEIEENKKSAEAKIELLRITYPKIISSLETHIATKLLLTKERKIIYDLANTGMLDYSEAKKMIDAIEKNLQEQ